MSIQAISIILLYLTATVLLALRLKNVIISSVKIRFLFNLIGFSALILHANLLYSSITISDGLNLSFFNALSLIGWMVPLIVMLTALFRPLETLLLVLYPIAIATILLDLLLPGERLLTEPISIGLRLHILLSVSAYSLLMISSLQALILALQERMIKGKRAAYVMNILPPLQVMENLLIELIVIGFFLLSLSLASGMMFINDLFAQHLAHKTILSIMAWIIYCILLWGRWSRGWRGKTIIRWTIVGFIALLLAYFGSKFVLELLLQRV